MSKAYVSQSGKAEIALRYAESLIANNENNEARKVLEELTPDSADQQEKKDKLLSEL